MFFLGGWGKNLNRHDYFKKTNGNNFKNFKRVKFYYFYWDYLNFG
ncbi:MAG: hypothetical protein CM15mP122_4440 [Bacteroidota bacterium]|nr:MAG: hypothetical protein CM15mP122_4440 [Bacteroidota bacterium]